MDSAHVYKEINPCYDSDKFLKEFEVLALDNLSGVFKSKSRMNERDVRAYINTDVTIPGTTQILISRHKDHLRREIRPAFSAYSTSLIALLQNQWGIPSTYQQFRTYANACGTLQRYIRRNESGEIETIGLILRVPHSPRYVKSIWSLALCWDPKLGRTCALFDGAADADVQNLQGYLNSRPRLHGHPLTLPTILMDLLSRYKITTRNLYERILFELEISLGVTRARGGKPTLSGSEDLFRPHELDEITMKCNQLMTSITYQARNQVFIQDLAGTIDRELSKQLFAALSFDTALQARLQGAISEMQDIVLNCSNLTMNVIHQTSCLEKRTQMLLNIIYLLIAQRDTRISIEIAAAAKKDSSIVTAIAVLTMIFLPATFITSFFGMNYFDFNNGTQELVVSKTFWLFWATSLPMTFIVLLLFFLWVWLVRPRITTNIIHQQNGLAPALSRVDSNPRSKLLMSSAPLTESIGPCYPPIRVN